MHVGSIQFRLLGLLAIGCLTALIACSGGGGGSTASTSAPTGSTAAITSIQVTPGDVTLDPSAQTQFSAALPAGTTGTVTWSAQLGTITSDGFYTAPATSGEDVITAMGPQSVSARVKVTIRGATTVTSVKVGPATMTLAPGGQGQFAATVTGTGNYSSGVTWTARNGTITSAGLYTAPASGGTDLVTATSVETPAQIGTADVVVTVPATVSSVSVSPLALTLDTGAQHTFSATVSGTGSFNAAVTWSAQRGAITSAGLYTAPASGGADVVTATSVQNPADTATANVTVTVPVSVSSVAVSPSVLSVNLGATAQFAATVSGSGAFSSAVTWTAQNGTITSAGLYTAPATGTADLVTATSVAAPAVAATASITLLTPTAISSVAVSPVTLSLNTGAQQTFTATVAGSGNYSSAVTWSAQRGTITSAGVYTAPATAGPDLVTAASAETPSDSASAQVTITTPVAVTSVAVSPTALSINLGATGQFTATVAGTGSYSSSVTWSALRGTITSAGLYTAPASGGSDVVTATSAQTPAVAATANITLVTPTYVSSVVVTPSSLSLNPSAQQQFSAAVSGAGSYSSSVTWSALNGTITSQGLYTAPVSGGSDVVTATSVQTPSVTGTASLAINTPITVTTVTVSPATLSLNSGAQQQFSATLAGTGSYSSSVTWSAQKGMITSAGLYTAPVTGGSDVVTATSVQTPSKSASVNVTVSVPATVTSVAVSPATLSLNAGAQQQFSATLAGTGSYSSSVTWSAKLGTVTSAGLYTAPAAGGSDVVTATSVQTPSQYASVNVTVAAPVTVTSVTVSPATASLNTGAQQQFSATLAGTGSYSSSVTWSAKLGTITSAGLYTAPASGGSDVVTAASVQTPATTGTASLTIVVPATVTTVTVSPATLSLNAGAQQQFSVTLAGTGSYSNSVTWSAKVGTVTSAGLYTAPAGGGSDVVTATSVQTPSKTASVNVTVAAPATVTSVAVTPSTLSLNPSAQMQFSATLTGTGSYSQAVTWSARLGTITSAGLYTAPAAAGSDVITATSVQTPAVAGTSAATIVASGTVTAVSVAPNTWITITGAQTQLSATVTGTGSYSSAVTWSAKRGTITASGLYTAPATSGNDTVTATSTQTSSVLGTCAMSVNQAATITGVTASPAALILTAGATNQFTATVAGTQNFNQGVTWTAQNGTITQAGLYTAPTAAGSDLVTATSWQDPNHTATVAVTIEPASGVLVPAVPVITSPTEVQISSGPYTAATTLSSGCTAQWTISGGTFTSGSTGASVQFQAGTGSYITLTCTVTNSAGSTSGSRWVVALPFAPRNYWTDLQSSLTTYAGAISTEVADGNVADYYSTSYYIHGMAAAAKATGNVALMQQVLGYVSTIMATAIPVVQNGITYYQLGPLSGGSLQQLEEFQMSGALARVAAVIAQTPAFKAQFGTQLTQIVNFLDQSIFQYWFDKSNGKYAYPASSYLGGSIPWLPASLGGWGTYDGYFNDCAAHLGMISTWMYQATGKPLYLEDATRVAQAFKQTHASIVNGCMVWDFGIIPLTGGNNDGSPDTSHGNREPMMVTAMYEAGIVFQLSDVQALGNTLANNIWNQSLTNPMFNNYISGGNEAFGTLGPYACGNIFHGWGELARYSPQAELVMALCWNGIKTMSPLNTSLEMNDDSYGVVEIPGIQVLTVAR